MKKTILLCCIFLMNCKTITKMSLNVKDPKFKTKTELYSFLEKHKLDTKEFYYFNSLESLFQCYSLKYNSVPNAYFFDENGYFVNYKKSAKECNAVVSDFILNLENFNTIAKDTTKNINAILPLLKGDSPVNIDKTDITVFITWASYLGDVNKEKAFKWVELLEEAKKKGIKVNYYLINYDLQKSWNLSPTKEKETEKLFNF